MGLIHFRGGPLNGYTYETEALLGTAGLELPVAEYNWTPEKLTSERDPSLKAQVWVHKDDANAGETIGAKTDKSTAPAPAPVPAAKTVDAEKVPVPAAAAPPAPQSAPAAATASTPAPVATVTVDNDGAVESSGEYGDLEERRKKLKLSRKDVADALGIAQSKVWGIETGKAKRITESDRKKLADYLQSQETERVGV